MRFGLCTGNLELIARGGELGLDYLDVSARVFQPFADAAQYEPVRRQLRRAPVPIEVVGGFLPAELKIVGPEVDWVRVRRYIEVVIERARDVGVEVINWGSAGSRHIPVGFSPAQAWAQLEQFCDLLAES